MSGVEGKAPPLYLNCCAFFLSHTCCVNRIKRSLQHSHLNLEIFVSVSDRFKGKAISDKELKFALQLAVLVELLNGAKILDLNRF